MSEDKKFANKVELENWLKERGVDEDDVADAAEPLLQRGFNKPSRLIGIKIDMLQKAGLSDPLALELSNKLQRSPLHIPHQHPLRMFDLEFLNTPTGSSGKPHIHQDLMEFPLNELMPLETLESTIPLFRRGHFDENDSGKLYYSREIQIQNHCENLVKDVVYSCKYDLRTDIEAALNGLKVDIGVIRKRNNDSICGTIKVKQPKRYGVVPPDPDPMKHPKVVTQVMSQMIPLRTMYGVENVFAILTTYSEWRFFKWKMTAEDEISAADKLAAELGELNVSEEMAQTSAVENSFHTPQKIHKGSQTMASQNSPPMSPRPYTEIDGRPEEETEPDADLSSDDPPLLGRLYASEVIPAGTEALKILAWVLGEMNRSPVRHVPAHERDFLNVVQKDALGGYERLPHDLSFYKGRMPKSSNAKLYIIEELGHRFHGRVFRAMSKNGNLCVIKYFTKPQHALIANGQRKEINPPEIAEKAADYWNKAYDASWLPRSSAGKWGGGDAVIMPDLEKMSVYLDHGDVLLKLKHTMQTRFHDSGLWHNDPAWRNVAIVRDKKGIISKVCMIDLEPEFMIENLPGSEWKGFDDMWTDFEARLHADWEHFKAAEMA